MEAQQVYDFRGAWEFCSGSELADFFRRECGGDPAPSGSMQINAAHATDFVCEKLGEMAHNSPSLVDHCDVAHQAWNRLAAS